jgi:hypothetical protein
MGRLEKDPIQGMKDFKDFVKTRRIRLDQNTQQVPYTRVKTGVNDTLKIYDEMLEDIDRGIKYMEAYKKGEVYTDTSTDKTITKEDVKSFQPLNFYDPKRPPDNESVINTK